ncbi:hypothetical protein CAURIC_05610 [Corynebacterium auriscanis]|nr:transcription antitermination factor NusB [Corynebacterium auriscanis]WJY72758.1 hypothetical protein CAURIC_05610 [Corynebacterium auriscanis]
MSGNKNNYRRHGSRFKARRRAVDIIFEAEFRDLDPVKIVEERRDLSRDPANAVKPVPEYTATIVEGTATHLDAIDDAIALNLASEWRLDRLPAVDRAVLRVATWELLFNSDVPNQVAMTEGIELAAQYSHDKAPSYVNAVLDGVARAADLKLADAAEAKATESDRGPEEAEDAELDALIGNVISGDGLQGTAAARSDLVAGVTDSGAETASTEGTEAAGTTSGPGTDSPGEQPQP